MFQRKNPIPFWSKIKSYIIPPIGFKRAFLYLYHRIGRAPDRVHTIARGLASGVAVSMTPFVGFHITLTIILCFIIRGNIFSGIVGTLIGNPITFPFIWLTIYYTGVAILPEYNLQTCSVNFLELFQGMRDSLLDLNFDKFVTDIYPVIYPMIIGSIPFLLLSFFLTYYFSIGFIKEYQIKRQERIAKGKEKNALLKATTQSIETIANTTQKTLNELNKFIFPNSSSEESKDIKIDTKPKAKKKTSKKKVSKK